MNGIVICLVGYLIVAGTCIVNMQRAYSPKSDMIGSKALLVVGFMVMICGAAMAFTGEVG